MIPIIRSSPTSCPCDMIALARSPIAVPSWTASRRISPVEIFGIDRLRAICSACVPLPAPGGPNRMRCSANPNLRPPPADARLFHEAVVMPHDQLRLDLLHLVHRHADDDQQRGAAEEERDVQ